MLRRSSRKSVGALLPPEFGRDAVWERASVLAVEAVTAESRNARREGMG
jgi:hypothetical protein